MYEIRPSDITLPPTVSIDLSHLVVAALEAAATMGHAKESKPAA
ncbi:hypothetical protein [Homoserinimonas hongtaonis]|nr:hypothetical protein [Salinibacterium hongtaonis]